MLLRTLIHLDQSQILPAFKWMIYINEYFQPSHHPSGFAVLLISAWENDLESMPWMLILLFSLWIKICTEKESLQLTTIFSIQLNWFFRASVSKLTLWDYQSGYDVAVAKPYCSAQQSLFVTLDHWRNLSQRVPALLHITSEVSAFQRSIMCCYGTVIVGKILNCNLGRLCRGDPLPPSCSTF